MIRLIMTAVVAAAGLLAISCTGTAAGISGQSTYVSATYHVDKDSPVASDANPGSPDMPWKTLMRAGKATELKPGDTVLIHSGVYRESMAITVSGEPGKPVVFAAAPGAKVVIKGSELIKTAWTKVSPEQAVPETYPNQYRNVWKVKLGEEFFTDPADPAAFKDKAKRRVAQVVLGDSRPLPQIGPDSKSIAGTVESWVVVEPVGKGLEDLRTETYYFDRNEQTLYTRVGGEPGWYSIEVSVRNNLLGLKNVHDVIVRGLEVRHSRGGLAGINRCQRVILEDCKLSLSAFQNLGIHTSSDCIVRRCELSWAGNTGLCMSITSDCVIEDCTIMFNNYRQFGAGWHDGGMKNIPGNKRTTIRGCEVAYNFSDGIWFDMLNVDIRILDNIIHHNAKAGIHYEANFGPGVIAGNLVYSNGGDGISSVGHADTDLMIKIIKGEAGDVNEKKFVPLHLTDSLDFPDQILYIVNNTLVENSGGISTSHSDGSPEFGQTRMLKNVRVLNNLFLRNGQPGCDPEGKYADLRFWMHADKDGKRPDMNCHSDYNGFAAGTKPVLKSNYHYKTWGKERTLAEWQTIFNEDRNSRLVPADYRCSQSGFVLKNPSILNFACPLPASVTDIWKPANPSRIGSNLTSWPSRE